MQIFSLFPKISKSNEWIKNGIMYILALGSFISFIIGMTVKVINDSPVMLKLQYVVVREMRDGFGNKNGLN